MRPPIKTYLNTRTGKCLEVIETESGYKYFNYPDQKDSIFSGAGTAEYSESFVNDALARGILIQVEV